MTDLKAAANPEPVARIKAFAGTNNWTVEFLDKVSPGDLLYAHPPADERIAALEAEIKEWQLLNTRETGVLIDHLAKVKAGRDAAVADAVAKEREACARACESLAEDRLIEFGVTEPDTNASYYTGRDADEYELRHEEDDACAAAIRARSKP